MLAPKNVSTVALQAFHSFSKVLKNFEFPGVHAVTSKTLFFHVGTVKTGSTSVQRVLWENRDNLLACGVAYPAVSEPRLDLPRFANADFLFQEDFDRAAARDALESAGAENLVISEEALWGKPHVMLDSVFEGFEKVIVTYVRNPADLVASWAAENAEPYNAMTNGLGNEVDGPLQIDLGLEEFTKRYNANFRKFLDSTDDMRRKGFRIVYRPFEKDQLVGGNVVLDLFDVIGMDPEQVPRLRNTWANKSRSRKFCDVSTYVWEYVKDTPNRARYSLRLVENVYNQTETGDDRAVIATMDDASIRKIVDDCAHIEERISRDYLEGRPLLQNPFPKVYSSDREPYAPVSERELEALCDKGLVEILMKEVAELKDLRRKMVAAFVEKERVVSERDHAIAERDHAIAERDHAIAERDHAIAERVHAIAERDHAIRYPWKYVSRAMSVRIGRKQSN
ncbi:hypothetical protein [Ruegeria sp. HKCCE4150]|uniref:hypothetical protein n=1 Tax=Ruegeria sp. HKCCE4150 TaxID=2794828 RepID=UPI001AE35B4D|nr:hypothetical protein [Ruegeria sp. HKCCE4150]